MCIFFVRIRRLLLTWDTNKIFNAQVIQISARENDTTFEVRIVFGL